MGMKAPCAVILNFRCSNSNLLQRRNMCDREISKLNELADLEDFTCEYSGMFQHGNSAII